MDLVWLPGSGSGTALGWGDPHQDPGAMNCTYFSMQVVCFKTLSISKKFTLQDNTKKDRHLNGRERSKCIDYNFQRDANHRFESAFR
jgi:hypothetical protein